MKTSLSPTLRFLLGFACLVIALAGLQRAATVFNQLALALLISVTALPLMNWLRCKGLSSTLSLAITAVSILLILAFFVGFMAIAISSLAKSIPAYATEMERLQASIEAGLSDLGLDASGAFPALLGQAGLTQVAVFLGYWIINGSAENIIKPKIMGEGLNLSPATVSFSVILWSALLGPLGALLGVPLTMAVKELVLEADEYIAWITRLIISGDNAGIALQIQKERLWEYSAS